MSEVIQIRPQPGPQTAFLSSSSDIAIYGGAAFGGKTWALLIEPLRHIQNRDFGAVIFRRTYSEVTMEGGMWDESGKLYPLLEARANQNELTWTFPSGARISFAHMQHESDKYNYRGAQIALLLWDQLETFSEGQFFYLLSRNRSQCGVRPYVRATCNPDPDSWLADFLAWWIDPETGLAIPERSGRLRYFVRDADQLVWADSAEELKVRYPKLDPQSVTFIPSNLYDNKIGMERDPGYLGRLLALTMVERERLLNGNWKIRSTAGKVFRREWFEIVNVAPADLIKVRYWDLAGTEAQRDTDPDWTAGALVGIDRRKILYLLDMQHARARPAAIEELIKQTAELDGKAVPVWIEQEPGASGKATIDHYARHILSGYAVRGDKVTGSKLNRADPVSAQAEAGNIKLLYGPWNKEFLDEAQSFPEGAHDDQVDALDGAYKVLTLSPGAQLAQEAQALRERIEQAKRESNH